MTSTGESVAVTKWYRSLGPTQWRSLLAANLGWLFDGFETYALILTAGVAFRQLNPGATGDQAFHIGLTIALTLFGWGVGGIAGGIVADYLGRKRVLIVAIILYSLCTGLSAFAWSWESFLALRLLTGVALGSEWGTGTSLVAEIWPPHARAKAAGFMQCGLGLGFFAASAAWFFLAPSGPDAWRYMFLLGVLPALFTLWLRRHVPESESWNETRERRARLTSRNPDELSAGERAFTSFTLGQLWTDPRLRRLTILGTIMSTVTTLAWWGISTWVPAYVGRFAASTGHSAERWTSGAGMIYNLGAIAGYISLGFLADRFGRKKTVFTYFAGALVMTPVLFLWTQDFALVVILCAVNGFFTLGQYTWMPVWLPEFYPTHLRATGAAFVFNAARFVAFLGPLTAGTIIAALGGYGKAATALGLVYVVGMVAVLFCPETKGSELPTR
jgi:MFS family permease